MPSNASPKIPMADGAEYDLLTGWRKHLVVNPDTLKFVKRKYRRRLRRTEQRDIEEQL